MPSFEAEAFCFTRVPPSGFTEAARRARYEAKDAKAEAEAAKATLADAAMAALLTEDDKEKAEAAAARAAAAKAEKARLEKVRFAAEVAAKAMAEEEARLAAEAAAKAAAVASKSKKAGKQKMKGESLPVKRPPKETRAWEVPTPVRRNRHDRPQPAWAHDSESEVEEDDCRMLTTADTKGTKDEGTKGEGAEGEGAKGEGTTNGEETMMQLQ